MRREIARSQIMADLEKLSNKELRKKCVECGLTNIPVTDSTRKLLIRKIQACISGGGNQKTVKNVKRLGTKKPAEARSSVKTVINTKIRVKDDVSPKKESLNLTRRSLATSKTTEKQKESLNLTRRSITTSNTAEKQITCNKSTKTTDTQPASKLTKLTTKKLSVKPSERFGTSAKNNLSISQRPSENITSSNLFRRDYLDESLLGNFGICHTMQPKTMNSQMPSVKSKIWPHNASSKSQVLTKTPVFCTSFIQESSIYRT
ncbi:uncharacterized protein [Musca autumnalis]|uniref:uncharacterized protein n=1 Tax=Musca autumnalis TaxID=221902 RepID=UPI003CEC14DC